MSRSPQHILVIKLSALGDFIQVLGPMRAIRTKHKDDKITLLTTKPFTAIAEKSNYFDNIIIDKRPKFYQLAKWLELRKKLNRGNFSRVYDLQNNDRTQIYFNLMHPKPEWVGTAKGASHRNTSPTRKSGLAFHGHVQTLALADIKNIEIDNLSWMSSDISHLNIPKKYALIVPGCAPTRPEKRWPATYFGALCNALLREGITPVLIGTPDEQVVTDEIVSIEPKALNLNGKTSLFNIVDLAKKAAIAIGNDTGPMHMIGPTGCKTLVLFSSHSDPKRHAPLGNNVECLQENELADLHPKVVIKRTLSKL